MTLGRLEVGTVVEVVDGSIEWLMLQPNVSDWLPLPYGVGVGWQYDGTDWTGPDGEQQPVEPIDPDRYILTGAEWVERFTDAEWAWLKAQRNQQTAAGVKLDRLMDAIRWTNSVDLQAPVMGRFYEWLLNQGIPGGQSRIDELRAPT